MEDRFRFRAWDKKQKKYYNDIHFNLNWNLYADNDALEEMGISDRKDCIIQQCTGLKDKNGKLIYEGDIIKYPNPSTKAVSIIFEVYKGAENISSRCGFYEKLQYDNAGISKAGHWYLCEIIGNIYENPKLINKQ